MLTASSMKKTSSFALIGLIVCSGWLLSGCKPDKTVPVSERLTKSWTASKVDENTTTVYTRGGAANVRPGYANWLLNLQAGGVATYKEYDGTTFTGTWAVTGDTKLTLSGLTPQPSGSGGTLDFTITELADASVTLTRTTASPKTGGTINKYNLTNP
jgi:hypothetical protein